MDWDAAREGIARDLGELASAGAIGWLVIAAVVALPCIAVVVARRSRLAWLAIALWVVTLGAWVGLYATDAPNPGAVAAWLVLAPVAAGWLVIALTLRRRAPRADGSRMRAAPRPDRTRPRGTPRGGSGTP